MLLALKISKNLLKELRRVLCYLVMHRNKEIIFHLRTETEIQEVRAAVRPTFIQESRK